MINFLKYLIVWISQNLAIPFWTVGHIHLMTTIHEDIHEVLVSCGMNIVVLLGFILNYYEEHKK